MHIPYMKVAIYALTFMTYAYSGYGSNVISSLRDAIIAAEAIFGDVFKNLITVAKKFKIVHEVFDAAVEENCVFTCPNGATPVRNKLYMPSSDGCGALGLKINSEYLPAAEMEGCCNDHDICYDTCNSDKELCDIEFKRCLYKYCDGYDKSAVADLVVKGCKAAAKMLFTGTLTLGCKAYRDSQGRACYCPATTPSAPPPPDSKSYYKETTNEKAKNEYHSYPRKDNTEYPRKEKTEYPNNARKENNEYPYNTRKESNEYPYNTRKQNTDYPRKDNNEHPSNNKNYGWKDPKDL